MKIVFSKMKSILGKLSNLQLNLKTCKTNINNVKSPLSSSRKTKIPSLLSIEKQIYRNFKTMYSNDKDFFNIKIINEIICNESTHIVAMFKDYLISGDFSEFLQKYYEIGESEESLPKIYDYYESCSVIFPNYVILPESKYLYKNIQRKQRVIDNQQEQEMEMEKKTKGIVVKVKEDKVFNTQVFDSLLNQTDTSTMRAYLGLSPKNLDTSDDSMVKVVDAITKAEIPVEKCYVIKKQDIKGRNYKRVSGYYSNNSGTGREENIFSSSDLKSNNTVTLRGKEYNKFKTKNSNNKKSLINTLLQSTNRDIVIKAFRDLNKMKMNKYPLNHHTVTQKSSNVKRHKKNNSYSKVKSITNSNSNKTIKPLSPKNNIVNVLSSSSISTANVLHTKNGKNILSIPKLSNQIPLTAREPQKFSINPEIMAMLNSKIQKMKNFTKTKTSNSISHKKTFTSSSTGTATGSYNTKNIDDKSTSKKNINYISVAKAESLSKTNSGKIAVRSSLTISNKNSTCDCDNNIQSLSPKENTKVLKTYTHFQSQSSLIGNANISNSSSASNKHYKKSNVVIPVRRNYGIKGIQIKGFDELIEKSGFVSRNVGGGISNSERGTYNSNINNYGSKTGRNSQKNIKMGRTMSSVGYFEMFRTMKKNEK